MDLQTKLKLIMEGQYEAPATVLHEAYYGGNAQLLKCEELFEQAMKSVSGDVEIKQIQAILQEMFNFRKLVISTFPLSLGATIPISMYQFKYAKHGVELERTPAGVAFKSEDQVEALMFLDLTLIRLNNLTGKEGVAIILHEIGHSIQSILPSEHLGNAIGALNFATRIIPMISFSTSQMHGGRLIDAYEELDKTYVYYRDMVIKHDREIQVAVKGALQQLSWLGYSIVAIKKIWKLVKEKSGRFILDEIFGGFQKKFRMGLRALMLPAAYKAEVFADYIATMYGYGPYITSGLGKLVNNRNTMSINNVVFRLAKLPFNIIDRVLDPHPNDLTRFKRIIKNLEDELQKEVNKEAYDMIKKDLDAAKENLDNFIYNLEKHAIRNADIIIYKRFLGLLINGNDDIKGLFFDLKQSDIEYLDKIQNQ